MGAVAQFSDACVLVAVPGSDSMWCTPVAVDALCNECRSVFTLSFSRAGPRAAHMAVFSSAKAAREPSSRPRQGEAVVIVRLRARRWAGYRAVTVMLFVVAAVGPRCTSLTGSNCESFPIPPFGLHGLVYQRTTSVGEPVAAADVVDAVETINDSSLPSAASRCGSLFRNPNFASLSRGCGCACEEGVRPQFG